MQQQIPAWTIIAGLHMETNVPVYGFPLQLGTAHYVNNLIMDNLGGVGANLSVGIQKLGLPTQLVSIIGQDFIGTEVLWELTGYGVETKYIRADWERTPRTIILVAPGGDRQLLNDFGSSSAYRYPQDVLADALGQAGQWVYASTHDWVRYAARVAREMGKFVVIDVHDVQDIDDYHRDFYSAANLIFVSMARLRPSLVDFARYLHDGFDVQTVIGMDGARGAWLVDAASGERTHFPAIQVDHVVDTVGAGDALTAGFCAALSSGRDMEACMRVGLRVAAHKIQYRGTLAFPEPDGVGLEPRKEDLLAR